MTTTIDIDSSKSTINEKPTRFAEVLNMLDELRTNTKRYLCVYRNDDAGKWRFVDFGAKVAASALALVLLVGCATPNSVSVDANIGIDTGATATAQPVPTVTPWATSQPATSPIRVQFGRGTWGTTLDGSGNQAYLLWACGGQTMTVKPSSQHPMNISLLAPDGQQVPVEVVQGAGSYKLPVDGDYTLSFVTDGGYSVVVEIRPSCGG